MKRSELLRRLSDLARKFSMQTVFLQQAIAQTVALNATDTRCLDLIHSHPNGVLTAGRLSDLTGLTTGAITHIVDRLERQGFVERVRDTEDRRRVFVRVRSESLAPLLPKYRALGKAYAGLVEHYSNSELTLILDYMEKMSQMTERFMADILAARGDG
ncbi:MAG: MarR family transcriptional regulator [Acidobacteriaceae bacterium]|nr:MarR family transcriptional regulator [Acidobacteriaceae bacterium]